MTSTSSKPAASESPGGTFEHMGITFTSYEVAEKYLASLSSSVRVQKQQSEQINDLKVELLRANTALTEAQSKKPLIEEVPEDYNQLIDELKEKLLDLCGQFHDLQKELLEREARMKELQKHVSGMTVSMEVYDALKKRVEHLERAATETKSDHAGSTNAAHAEELTKLQETLDAAIEERNGLQQCVDELKGDATTTKAELASAKADHAKEITELQEILNTATEKRDQLKERIDQLERAAVTMTDKSSQTEADRAKQITELQNALRLATQEHNELQQSVNELKRTAEATKGNHAQELAEIREKLRATTEKRDELQKRVEDLKSAADTASTNYSVELRRLQTALDSTAIQSDSLTKRMEEVKRAAETASTNYAIELGRLQAALNSTSNQRDGLTKRVEELEQAATSTATEHANELDGVRKDLKTAADKCATFEQRIKDLEQAAETTKTTHAGECDALKQRIENLKTELEETKAKRDEAGVLLAAGNQCEGLKKDLEAAHNNLTSSEDRVQASKKQVELLETKLREATARIKALEESPKATTGSSVAEGDESTEPAGIDYESAFKESVGVVAAKEREISKLEVALLGAKVELEVLEQSDVGKLRAALIKAKRQQEISDSELGNAPVRLQEATRQKDKEIGDLKSKIENIELQIKIHKEAAGQDVNGVSEQLLAKTLAFNILEAEKVKLQVENEKLLQELKDCETDDDDESVKIMLTSEESKAYRAKKRLENPDEPELFVIQAPRPATIVDPKTGRPIAMGKLAKRRLVTPAVPQVTGPTQEASSGSDAEAPGPSAKADGPVNIACETQPRPVEQLGSATQESPVKETVPVVKESNTTTQTDGQLVSAMKESPTEEIPATPKESSSQTGGEPTSTAEMPPAQKIAPVVMTTQDPTDNSSSEPEIEQSVSASSQSRPSSVSSVKHDVSAQKPATNSFNPEAASFKLNFAAPAFTPGAYPCGTQMNMPYGPMAPSGNLADEFCEDYTGAMPWDDPDQDEVMDAIEAMEAERDAQEAAAIAANEFISDDGCGKNNIPPRGNSGVRKAIKIVAPPPKVTEEPVAGAKKDMGATPKALKTSDGADASANAPGTIVATKAANTGLSSINATTTATATANHAPEQRREQRRAEYQNSRQFQNMTKHISKTQNTRPTPNASLPAVAAAPAPGNVPSPAAVPIASAIQDQTCVEAPPKKEKKEHLGAFGGMGQSKYATGASDAEAQKKATNTDSKKQSGSGHGGKNGSWNDQTNGRKNNRNNRWNDNYGSRQAGGQGYARNHSNGTPRGPPHGVPGAPTGPRLTGGKNTGQHRDNGNGGYRGGQKNGGKGPEKVRPPQW